MHTKHMQENVRKLIFKVFIKHRKMRQFFKKCSLENEIVFHQDLLHHFYSPLWSHHYLLLQMAKESQASTKTSIYKTYKTGYIFLFFLKLKKRIWELPLEFELRSKTHRFSLECIYQNAPYCLCHMCQKLSLKTVPFFVNSKTVRLGT